MDLTRGYSQAVAARRLLGESAWHLHCQLSDRDFNDREGSKVVFNYAVEQLGVQLQRSAAEELVARYEAAVVDQTCRVGYGGGLLSEHKWSLSGAEAALSRYSEGANAPTTIGISREILHLEAVTQGAQLEGLFVKMWLIHLSVLAQRFVTVTVDRTACRRLLGIVRVEDECDAAKLLLGVRLDGRNLDDQSAALVVAACSQFNNMQDVHPRARRYRFPTTPLTIYGTNQAGIRNIRIDDARASARAILGFSNRFDAADVCGKALRTALVLFGAAVIGERVSLTCAEPSVHENTHASYGRGTLPHDRCSELSEQRLLSLALFMGRTYMQAFGHVLRASMMRVNATDVDAARDAILPHHTTIIALAGRTHEKLFYDMSTLISATDYALYNHRRLWGERGVLHCIASGTVVAGSVIEEVIQPISVPEAQSLSPSDDPAHASEMKTDWGALTLIEALVENGGEVLAGSSHARVHEAAGGFTLSQDTRCLCGSTVMFTLLSMGDVITVTRGPKGVAVEPEIGTTDWEPPVLRAEVTPMEYSIQRAPTEAGVADIDDLLTRYVPAESVVRLRSKLEAVEVRGASETVLEVREPDGAGVVGILVDAGWGVEPTSGEGLLCGARAVINSLAAMGETTTTAEAFAEGLANAMPREVHERMREGGVHPSRVNLTIDQLAAGVAMAGNHRLVVIVEDASGAHVVLPAPGREGARDIAVHYRDGHWSSIGPRCSVRLAAATQRGPAG
jgi:hypothetical protein